MSLKKYLQQFTKDQLIDQIMELQKKYKAVKTHYAYVTGGDHAKLIDKVKKDISSGLTRLTDRILN